MTPTTTKDEITGGEVRRGQIVQLTDDFHGTHGTLTIFVLDIGDAGGTILVDGVAVAITTTNGTFEVFGDVIVSVADLEPVGLLGTMDPADWSADYARRAAMA